MSLHPQAIRFRALRDECHNEYKKFQIQLSQQQAETHAHGSNGTARSHNHKHKDKDALPAPLKPQMSSNFASSTQKKGPPVLDPEEQQKKVMQLKVENLSQRVETLDNIQWWIRQILRTAFRKKKILESSYQDLQERLRFVSLEYYRLDRILLFVDARISDGARNSKRSGKGSSEQLTLKGNEGTSNAETKESNSDRDSLKGEAGSKEKDEELAKMQKLMDGSKVDNSLDWLAVYREFIINQLVLLDGQQESLLKEEIVKIQKEEKEMQILHSLLAELIQSLQVNIQLCAERMSLEKRLVMLPYGSEEAIQCNEQLILLKNKQKILTNQSIDSLKLTLQDVLDGFDKKILELYAFPNDHPDLSIDDMSDLQIVPLEPYSAPKAIAFEEFVMIYFLQPWLVNQCIEDIRYEERINHKLIRYQAYQEEHHNYQDQVKDGSQQVTTLMEECKEIETQILARMDPDEDESEGERIQRETQLNVFRAVSSIFSCGISV